MSKFAKAQNENTNNLSNWAVTAITMSAKVGMLDNTGQSLRSKIFWIRLPNGKV